MCYTKSGSLFMLNAVNNSFNPHCYEKSIQKRSLQEFKKSSTGQTGFKSVRFADIAPYFASGGIETASTIKLPGTDRGVELLCGKKLLQPVKDRISAESAKRVNGEYNWPIKNGEPLVPWMVSAETATFMKIGGLAQIAVDLPGAFNERFKDRPDTMPIVTPLYENDSPEKGEKTGRLQYKGENNYTYKANGSEINLKEVKKLYVPAYENGKQKNKPVSVLAGKMGNTNYIFLRNSEYFDVKPAPDNLPVKEGAYVLNRKGIDETERFAFFSKAVYELMKARKEKEIEGVPEPNIVVANDWHAGSIASLTRYKGIAEKEGQPLKDIPIVHIVHNLQHQGWDYGNTDKILNTLFEKSAKDIVTSAKSPVEDNPEVNNSLYVRGTYNSVSPSLNLADRVVAVSPHYKQEMLQTDILSYDFQKLFEMRQNAGTMLGITNGYDRAKLEPSERFVGDINNAFGLEGDDAFKPYELDRSKMDDNKRIEVKKENKKKFISLLEKIVNGEKQAEGVELYKTNGNGLDFSHINPEKTPVIVSVGRLVNQKGFDMLADSIEELVKRSKDDNNFPLVVILGAGDEYPMNKLKDMKQKLSQDHPEASKHIFLFQGFSNPLRMAMMVGGDMFAMPSKFEPCGLTQMESMPVGCVPVATATGGLVTTIKDKEDGFLTDEFYSLKEEEVYKTKEDGSFVLVNGKPTVSEVKHLGFHKIKGEKGSKEPRNAVQAYKKDVKIFADTLGEAIAKFDQQPKEFEQMQLNAMKKDFSWGRELGSLDAYVELFKTGKVHEEKGITF